MERCWRGERKVVDVDLLSGAVVGQAFGLSALADTFFPAMCGYVFKPFLREMWKCCCDLIVVVGVFGVNGGLRSLANRAGGRLIFGAAIVSAICFTTSSLNIC